ncbi:uncharacterized protein LOC133355475 [Lethenteron reissneri]|uniref:uncharacterized protein LOC133355475 n=1 Tax=Lethenteron reissneri TaxID=7753 RepID=UPI002AB66B9E|nr:uncharacterized protein LOC133355475 [Lethenteron reissneri]
MDFMRTGHLDTWQTHATAWALSLSGITSKASTPPPIVFPPFPLPLHTPLSPPPPPPPPPPPHGPPRVQRRRCFRFPRPRWDSDDCNDDDDDDDDDDDNGGGGGWGFVKRSRPGSASPSLVPMHHVWVLNNSEGYGDLSAFALRHPPLPPPPLPAPPRIPVGSPESSQTIGTATVASRILQQQQARPSVIVCAPASSRDSRSRRAQPAPGGTPTAPRNGGMDEHEGRPGGVGRPGWQRALPLPPPPQSPPQSPPAPQSSPPAVDLTAPMARATSIAGSVDDHFRQSLGDLWLQIKATESASPPTSASPIISASPLTSLSPPASV